jgi:hypothetical protein
MQRERTKLKEEVKTLSTDKAYLSSELSNKNDQVNRLHNCWILKKDILLFATIETFGCKDCSFRAEII